MLAPGAVRRDKPAMIPGPFDTPADAIDLSGPIAVGADRLDLVHPPRARFDAVVELVEGARTSLRVVLYMLGDDPCGTAVRDALVAAARRGIRVTALFDRFGSNELAAGFLDPLAAAGATVGWFNARAGARYLVRNHQKIWVADGQRALVAGFNATDHYFGCSGVESWEDLGVLIEGPTAGRLADYCDRLYAIALDGKPRFRAVRKLVRTGTDTDGPVRILIGGPLPRLNPWTRSLKRDLERGGRLDLVAAYFSPGFGLARRIGRLARRGGGGKGDGNRGARLVLAGRTDNIATVAAGRFLYGMLLKKGAEIREYQPCCLHMKLIVIDDVAYLGSANLDARSLFINMEIMLRIESREVAARLRGLIDSLAASAEPQTADGHARRTGPLRWLRWALSYFAVAVLDYGISRGASR